ncbi:MAG: LytTR family DNA-binding domain-containing protein [Acutalibacteraceae bacterium]|nr:LytTR family DNA-binding domain-containing protein [Acutalibacteraceae bacterium]
MKILICDDEQQYVDELKIHIENFMQSRVADFTIDTANNPQAVADSNEIYQLAFLDIQMDELNGISLAKNLKERNNKIVIFFVTSHNDYQDEAMDLRAFRFFEKPLNADRLYSGLEKAMEYIDESYVDFYVWTDNEHKQILVDDVIYVERGNRQVTLVTTQGNFTTRESFDEWCAILQNSFFYRVHKSFIVNLHYVTGYKYSELFVQNNVRIPIASRRQTDFHKFWFAYLRRR